MSPVLPKATQVIAPGDWRPTAQVSLGFHDRHRRRLRLTTDQGDDFLLTLDQATHLAHGDGLVLDSGDIVRVAAAAEAVADFAVADPRALARLAWHLGNRHTPVQVLDASTLRILDDHTLVAMAEGLGARVRRHTAPFDPEPGAYAKGHDHGA